jgi:hypothetical protein
MFPNPLQEENAYSAPAKTGLDDVHQLSDRDVLIRALNIERLQHVELASILSQSNQKAIKLVEELQGSIRNMENINQKQMEIVNALSGRRPSST